MGAVLHISEEDAARDFAALLARVRLADLVVVDCKDGTEALIRLRKPAVEIERRTIAESRELLRKRRELQGLAAGSPELATEMQAVHLLYNEPMDSSRWTDPRYQSAY